MNVVLSFSLVEIGREWFEDAVETVIEWFQQGLTEGYEEVTEELLGTPVPETGDTFVFGTPQNEPWTDLHDALVAGEIMLLALLLLVICVQGRHTIRIFNFGSSYEARKARRSSWTGAFLIVTWYWVAVLSLYLVNGFTIALIPGFDTLMDVMTDFLAVSITNPALALLMAMIGGFAMWVLQALFFIREILLYVYLYAMPIGIAIAFGGLPIVSRVAKTVCMKFVPLAILPLPVAVFFKGYELLFSEGTDAAVAPDSAFLSYLVAASLPVLSLLIIWKMFKYASPITAKVIGGTTKAAVTAGTVAGAATIAGPAAATTAARWGPKAAAGHAAAQRLGSRRGGYSTDGGSGRNNRGGNNGGTKHDNVVTDAHGQQGVPSYRRTENDPGYY
ncbi:hypothetical protein [Natrialba sp. SSL1]|uniref:hypothetical protein n=1 Tax=Natrialba sp. SSL1 TaxID=1869245 RepID=UPI0008F952AD|nr:hypothetical protein [Natrialba sp. SSL1]OIB57333.1 hypothetical protein BBD46_02275 [Natrialba sp. SSL1]